MAQRHPSTTFCVSKQDVLVHVTKNHRWIATVSMYIHRPLPQSLYIMLSNSIWPEDAIERTCFFWITMWKYSNQLNICKGLFTRLIGAPVLMWQQRSHATMTSIWGHFCSVCDLAWQKSSNDVPSHSKGLVEGTASCFDFYEKRALNFNSELFPSGMWQAAHGWASYARNLGKAHQSFFLLGSSAKRFSCSISVLQNLSHQLAKHTLRPRRQPKKNEVAPHKEKAVSFHLQTSVYAIKYHIARCYQHRPPNSMEMYHWFSANCFNPIQNLHSLIKVFPSKKQTHIQIHNIYNIMRQT